MSPDQDYPLNEQTYEWSARAFRVVSKMLGVNLKLHHDKGQIEAGDIFLFNHFARVETFIPQYLIYNESGALCRSVASAEFFRGGDAFTKYLTDLGAVPNDHPRLLFLLAAEILKGRKVVIFPEGGMVKDRRVIDERGDYSVYSRTAMTRRKHHTGAAVLAILLDAFKTAVLSDYARGQYARLEKWLGTLAMDSLESLLAAARKPTTIVPANITFYPLHVDDNILRKSVERFSKNALSRRASEELLIEGNILLRKTDMDIRLGNPLRPSEGRPWWEQWLVHYLARSADRLEEFFSLAPRRERWDARILAKGMHKSVGSLRDRYMHRIYLGVTVNLSHLASQLIMKLIARGDREVEQARFHRMLYLAVKRMQSHKGAHLHRALRNPAAYEGLLAGPGHCAGLDHFLKGATDTGLIEVSGRHYRFLDKLLHEHDFDDIRRENPIAVYANESAPIGAVTEAVGQVIAEMPSLSDQELARLRFDDEIIAWRWDRKVHTKKKHGDINRQETATGNAEPYLMLPAGHSRLGVVMVHGFLASPAELRGFGEELAAAGLPVVGVRLKGHGTSPWDLRERKWQDWLASVRRGYQIMGPFAERICVIGFSTGGALSLLLASERPEGLAGVAVASVPVKFRNRKLIFVPLVHTANRLLKWVSSEEGPFPFRVNESQHPEINYRNIPIRGLYELRRAVEAMEEALPGVQCPVVVLQGTEDTVVDPKSAQILYKKLGSTRKALHMIPSNRHGIVIEDIGDTRRIIRDFLTTLGAEMQAARGVERKVS